MTAGRTVIRWVVLGLALAFGLWYGHSQFVTARDKAKAEKATAVKAAAEYARTHPPAPPTQPAAPVVRQLPDCTTPCTMGIAEIRDIYTDGEPVFMLPPGWSREKAIRYSGKGHIVVEGGNIHIGKWQFWSADDPTKVVLIRVFGR